MIGEEFCFYCFVITWSVTIFKCSGREIIKEPFGTLTLKPELHVVAYQTLWGQV